MKIHNQDELLARIAELEAKEARRAVVVIGNPVDGINIFGPFGSDEEAALYGERFGNGEWWLTTVQKPEVA